MKTIAATFAFVLVTATIALASPDYVANPRAWLVPGHMIAIAARDLAALEKTITSGETLELILPNGKRTTTRKEYIDFHREWFKAKNWTLTSRELASTGTADMSITTLRTRYEEKNGAKTTWSENWLTLTFKKEKDGWRLVRAQSTPIAKGR